VRHDSLKLLRQRVYQIVAGYEDADDADRLRHDPALQIVADQKLGHAQQYAACPSNYQFAGYWKDSETGLYYAEARYYNPRLGRFMSADPLGGSINPQSQNRYAYVLNNTENLIDPLGLWTMQAGNCFFYSYQESFGFGEAVNGRPTPGVSTSALGPIDSGVSCTSTDSFAGASLEFPSEAAFTQNLENLAGKAAGLLANRPQAPTQPKKPCTAVQNQAKGMTQLAEADHAVEGPLLFSLFPAGSAAVLGGMGTATGYACGVPEPGWVFACGGMVAVDIVGGGAIVVGNYFYFKNAGSIWKKLTSPALPPSGSDTCGGG